MWHTFIIVQINTFLSDDGQEQMTLMVSAEISAIKTGIDISEMCLYKL